MGSAFFFSRLFSRFLNRTEVPSQVVLDDRLRTAAIAVPIFSHTVVVFVLFLVLLFLMSRPKRNTPFLMPICVSVAVL